MHRGCPRLVLARYSLEDKRVHIVTHRNLGETVGISGDGMNDGFAFKTANLGFSTGITSTGTVHQHIRHSCPHVVDTFRCILLSDNHGLLLFPRKPAPEERECR